MPRAEKRRGTTPTFREAAQAVHEANLPRWRNAKHIDSWMQTLERHAMPTLGSMPVDRIEKIDVLSVLKPIWTAKPETGRRVRSRIRTTLKWAMAHGYVEHNVAGELIDGALPAQARKTPSCGCVLKPSRDGSRPDGPAKGRRVACPGPSGSWHPAPPPDGGCRYRGLSGLPEGWCRWECR